MSERSDLPALPRFRAGDVVARHVIEGVLADGAKHVYRARDVAAGRRVALKIVPVSALDGLPDPARTNGIDHVVTTFAIGVDEEWRVGFVAMDLVSGSNLAECIERHGRRPTAAERRERIAMLLPVARALQELHRRGVVHCDVKPHNLVLDEGSGRAVLVDLGIARDPGVPAVHSTLAHAAAYAAPEQLLGQCIDGRTDVFAFGVTLHDTLLGRSAVQRGERPTSGLARLDHTDPTIDADLVAIVAECTALQPARRYRGMRQLADDLDRWLAGRRPSVRPRAPWRRFARLASRHPRAAVGWVLLLAGVVALSAFATVHLAAAAAVDRRLTEFRASLQSGDLDRAAVLAADRSIGADALALDADTQAVLVRLQSGDAVAARLHAARLCSRDGLVAHPVLDKWFACLLASDSDAVRLDACRLLARVLYDRPRRTGEVMPFIADRLVGLARDDATEAALFAITATGGLGDLQLGDRLVAAAVRQANEHDECREYLRLLTEALHRLASREAVDGHTDAIPRAESQLRRCLRLLAEAPALEHWSGHVIASVSAWFATIRRWRDAAGLPPPDPSPLLACWSGDPLIRSLARSTDFVDELVAGRWDPAATALQLGTWVEYARPTPVQLERILGAIASREHLASPAARAEFSAGRESAARCLAGIIAPWRVDKGSRLADELTTLIDAGAWPVVRGAPSGQTAKFVASFDFKARPVVTSGSAEAVVGRLARHELDESRPPSGFAWLGSPGRSCLEVEFVEALRDRPEMVVAIEEQKGQRGAFPFGGEAAVDLLLDGELQASWRDRGGLSEREFPLALTGIDIGRRRRLTVRLRDESNTTLRVYSIVIR